MSHLYFPDDSYTTPSGPSDPATPFASRLPTLFFAWKAFGMVWRYGRLASAGKFPAEMWSASSFEVMQHLERCGIRFYMEGLSNIDAVDGPCVFIGNHMSTLETFVLPCLIQPRKNVTFVVKDSLVNYPLFGAILKSREPITVRHKSPREDFAAVMDQGCERLGRGMSVIVFPQGMRASSYDPAHFNSLGIKLAKKAGVPVLPLALRTDAWKPGRIIKDFGTLDPAKPVCFSFGQPMRIEGNGKSEHTAVCDFIARHWQQWGLLEAASPPQ